jgi:hypothetical protein
MSFDNVVIYFSTFEFDGKFEFSQQICELIQIQNMITFTPIGLVIARPLSTLLVGEKLIRQKLRL